MDNSLHIGLPDTLVNLIQTLHDGTQAQVVVGSHGSTKEFALRRGLKQGSILDPILFNIFFGYIVRTAQNEYKEMRLGMEFRGDTNRKPFSKSPVTSAQGEEINITEVLYAYDCVLQAESAEDLQAMEHIFIRVLTYLDSKCH